MGDKADLAPFSQEELDSAGSVLSLVTQDTEGGKWKEAEESSYHPSSEYQARTFQMDHPGSVSSHYEPLRKTGRGEEERRGQPLCRRDITWLWDIRNTSPTLVAAAREIDSDDLFIKGPQKEERMIPRRFRSHYALKELNRQPWPLDHFLMEHTTPISTA